MSRTQKDHNKANKSRQIPSSFKVKRRRTRRRLEKLSVDAGFEPPMFKKADRWDYW
jgi:hypothetical protein